MYRIKIILIILFLSCVAQAEDIFIISQNRYVSFFPIVQTWNDDLGSNFTEAAFPLSAYFPVNYNTGIKIQTAGASVTGKNVNTLAGLADTQVGISYFRTEINTVFNLGINLPSGKKEMTFEEYSTSYLMSFNHLNLHVPNFGQGLNISPGMNWAQEMSDNLVIGLAGSYQYKGSFKPFDFMTESYKPGNEFSATAGLDYTLNETSTLSADFIYTIYGKDQIAGNDVFASGNKTVAFINYQQYMGYNFLSILARFRSKAKNSIAVLGDLVDEDEKSTPNQYELFGIYRYRYNTGFYMNYLADIRIFEKTPAFPGMTLFGVGVQPEYKLSPTALLRGTVKIIKGSYSGGNSTTGFDIGLGITYNF